MTSRCILSKITRLVIYRREGFDVVGQRGLTRYPGVRGEVLLKNGCMRYIFCCYSLLLVFVHCRVGPGPGFFSSTEGLHSFHFVLSLRRCFSTSIRGFNFLLHDIHLYFLSLYDEFSLGHWVDRLTLNEWIGLHSQTLWRVSTRAYSFFGKKEGRTKCVQRLGKLTLLGKLTIVFAVIVNKNHFTTPKLSYKPLYCGWWDKIQVQFWTKNKPNYYIFFFSYRN